jgi:hypothetical protein
MVGENRLGETIMKSGVKRAQCALAVFLFLIAAFVLTLNLSGAGCAWLDQQSLGISFYTSTNERGCEIQWSERTRYSADGTASQLWHRPFIHWINDKNLRPCSVAWAGNQTTNKGQRNENTKMQKVVVVPSGDGATGAPHH